MKYETLKDMICRELEEIERKDELSTSDVDIVYKLIVAKEKIIRAEQIESEMANDTEWQISRQAIPGGSDHNYIIKKGRLYMDDKIEQMMNDPNLTAADRAAIRRSMDLIS